MCVDVGSCPRVDFRLLRSAETTSILLPPSPHFHSFWKAPENTFCNLSRFHRCRRCHLELSTCISMNFLNNQMCVYRENPFSKLVPCGARNRNSSQVPLNGPVFSRFVKFLHCCRGHSHLSLVFFFFFFSVNELLAGTQTNTINIASDLSSAQHIYMGRCCRDLSMDGWVRRWCWHDGAIVGTLNKND